MILLESQAHIPAWVFGVIALVFLFGALQIVRSVGKSRPHS